MRTISLKLPDSLDRTLTKLAASRGTTKSAIVREALEAYAAQSKRSVTALAGALVGSLRGPKDLSSSPRHLKGYGR